MDSQNNYIDLFGLNSTIDYSSMPPKLITDMVVTIDRLRLDYNSNQMKVPDVILSPYLPTSVISDNYSEYDSDAYSRVFKEDIFLNESTVDTGNSTTSLVSNEQQYAPIFMSECCSTDKNESPMLPPSSVVPCYELYGPANDDMLSDTNNIGLYVNDINYQKEMTTIATKECQYISTAFLSQSDHLDTPITSPLSFPAYEMNEQKQDGFNEMYNLGNISFYDDEIDRENDHRKMELDETTDMDVSSDSYLCERLTKLLRELEVHNNTNTTSDASLLTKIDEEYKKEISYACSFTKSGGHQHHIETLQLIRSVMDVYFIALQITGSNGDLKALSLSQESSFNDIGSSEDQLYYGGSDTTFSLDLESSFSIQVSSECDDNNSNNSDDDNGDDGEYEYTNRKNRKRVRKTKNESSKKQKNLGTTSGNKVTKKMRRSSNSDKKSLVGTKTAANTNNNKPYKKSRKNYTSDITSILMDWYLNNEGATPTMADKIELANETSKSVGQVSTWFQNARRRHQSKLDLFKIYSKEYPNKITDYKSLMKFVNAEK